MKDLEMRTTQNPKTNFISLKNWFVHFSQDLKK